MASFLSVCLLFLSVYTADGYLEYMTFRCEFTSSELKDIQYINSYYYNKLEDIRFDSRVGKFVGYTEHGVYNAENWNKDPSQLAQMRAAKETYCQYNIKNYEQETLPFSAKPYVRLHSTVSPSGSHPAMLVCSVYEFYPKLIKVSWIRNGQEVTSDVTSSEELADRDWYYQVHSHLEYTPRSGDKISCMVEHVSLGEPLVTAWDPSMPESERNKVAIGAAGLILGLTLSLAGFIYYKRKSRGRILVPSH
ncbi:H-2 class II histocompatibility antigen I-A beta chain [Dissostichus eleginoides]|uniref:H-2 class II histocompatibility antigen I-A beta chain n=1 Tax=Dissostichus eleginoides TaxID=100907 RepID=A0AAD9ESH3_DISEL|nr:H-2 class II histocompatibility antigen I-A beta chain [Dissostichus eleginoides]